MIYYITTLPQRISLSGQWECGLVEIQYPHSWYNVREDDTSLFIIDSDGSTYVEQIDAGYYPGADALIRAINRVITSMEGQQKIKLAYTNITQKVTMHITENMSFSERSPSLRQIVGIHQDVYSSPEKKGPYYYYTQTAESVVDMAQGIYALYVYTNVVEPRVVGDTVVPLLRAVPLEGKHGDVVSKSFDNVQYIPVLHKEFTTIEIDIRDDAGRRVPSERGRFTVTLHFRRRKPSFFET